MSTGQSTIFSVMVLKKDITKGRNNQQNSDSRAVIYVVYAKFIVYCNALSGKLFTVG